MLRIGVTGLMASGKTDVARRFAERGARVIEGDALGWEVLREPEIRDRIQTLFGPSVLAPDGCVDRRALGRVVFGDASELNRLNALVQPRLERRVRDALGATGGRETGAGVLVLDAALLGAWNLVPELNGVVLVQAPAETRIARLSALKGFPEAEARERVLAQRLPPVRGARRQWRIENTGTQADLLKRADEIWDEIERLQPESRSG